MKIPWKTKPLGEVCSFLNRGISPTYVESGGVCVLNQRCVRNHVVSFEFSRRHNLHAKGIAPERFVKRGDVLVNSTGTGTLGRVAQLRENPQEPTTVDSHVTIVRPLPGAFCPEFFGYMLIAIEHEIEQAGEGCGGQTELARATLAERFRITFPESIAEQRRIVGILDKAIAAIATAKAKTEKNLQNARALLQSYLENLFAGSNGHVKMRPLVSLCSYFADSAHRTPKYQTEGIPALRPRDVVNGELNLGEAARVSETEYEVQTKRHRPAPGDIVYSRELSYGWATMLPESPRVCLSQGMCIFRPSHEVDAKYLLYMLNGPIGRQQAEHAAVGTAHPHINLSDIKSYLIPFVPMPEQREISKTLSEIKSALCQIEHNCQKKIAALDTLKQSLLHQAFAGEL